jgi:hypothetical protein
MLPADGAARPEWTEKLYPPSRGLFLALRYWEARLICQGCGITLKQRQRKWCSEPCRTRARSEGDRKRSAARRNHHVS